MAPRLSGRTSAKLTCSHYYIVSLHIAITAPEEKPCEVAAAQRATAEPQVRFNAIAPANVPVPCAFECLRPRANPITRPITGLEVPHGANEHG